MALRLHHIVLIPRSAERGAPIDSPLTLLIYASHPEWVPSPSSPGVGNMGRRGNFIGQFLSTSVSPLFYFLKSGY